MRQLRKKTSSSTTKRRSRFDTQEILLGRLTGLRPSFIQSKVLNKMEICPQESNQLLLSGNKGFGYLVKSRKLDLRKLSDRDLEEIWVLCADARAGLILNLNLFAHHNIGIIFSAGNAISGNYPASRRILETLQSSSTDMAIPAKVIGHQNCGAVHHADGNGNFTQPKDMRYLLDEVIPSSVGNNAIHQLGKLTDVWLDTGKKGYEYASTTFEWDNMHDPISLSEGYCIAQKLKKAFKRRYQKDLIVNLDPQYAHAVAITSVNGESPLPFTAREIFGVERPNEVFCVTANADFADGSPAFDSLSFGSILYSLLNNKTNNIVLVHHDPVILNAWEKELTEWLISLKDSSHEVTRQVARKYFDCKISISVMKFDMSTGETILA